MNFYKMEKMNYSYPTIDKEFIDNCFKELYQKPSNKPLYIIWGIGEDLLKRFDEVLTEAIQEKFKIKNNE